MAVALCTTLAAIYLAVEARVDKDEALAESYRWRAIIAGALTAILGTLGLALAPSEAPLLWQGMLIRAVPVVIATMVIGLAAAVAVFKLPYPIPGLRKNETPSFSSFIRDSLRDLLRSNLRVFRCTCRDSWLLPLDQQPGAKSAGHGQTSTDERNQAKSAHE
jgi:hypothetical protein